MVADADAPWCLAVSLVEVSDPKMLELKGTVSRDILPFFHFKKETYLGAIRLGKNSSAKIFVCPRSC